MKINLEDLFIRLYKARYIETLWNAEKEQHRRKGWTLKSGLVVPWFFNMRPIGDEPGIFRDICCLMANMVMDAGKPDVLVGVEMAGLPLAGGLPLAIFNEFGVDQRFAYTRPLPTKLRTPQEVMEFFQRIKNGDFALSDYGQKELIEGRMRNGDKIAILDDMATDIGSKIMARLIVLWEASQRGVEVSCNQVFYFIDRGVEGANIQKGLDFAQESEAGLQPASLEVNFVMSFNKLLPCLEGVMAPAEFAAIMEHQRNIKRFHDDKEWRQELIKQANG